MKIQTSNFGEIQIDEDKIINFPEGLPGFENEKELFIIFNDDKDNPFHWLQSLNSPELSFVILNPFEIFADYDIVLPDTAKSKLKIESGEDVAIYTIVVMPEDITKTTTNLLGPIVINKKEKLGKQVILEEDKYQMKHLIFNQEPETRGE